MNRSRTGGGFTLRAVLVATLSGTVALPGQDKPAEAPKEKAPVPLQSLPAGVLARLNGRDITFEEYVGYLFASLGKSRLDELIDRLLVEGEAKRLGVSFLPDDVEKAVEERTDRTIKGLFQGNKDAFNDSLVKRRTNLEEHKAKLRQDLYYEMLWSDVILRTRQVTDADLKQQFERSYGEGGVQLTIRHILVAAKGAGASSPTGGASPSGAAGDADSGGATRTTAEARERAEKILKELQGGADFAQAVKQYSDDAFTKKNDGRIPHYRKGFYGDAFHKAVAQLTSESPLSGVVESPRGFHIVQLIEKQVTKLEDVKVEVEKLVKTQAPSAKERHDLITSLRAKAKIEGL